MPSPLQLDQYDVIICGGGTAGCVLANRLSEDADIKVLMLEAGENANEDPRVSTPALFPFLFDDPQRDWGFYSEPAPGLNGRVVTQPRGKCIGGSSAINFMGLIYPSKASIDAWSGLGNHGWAWDDLAPYYEKTLRRHPPSEEVRKALGLRELTEKERDSHGLIASTYPREVDTMQKAWMQTWRKLGREWAGYPLEKGPSAGAYISTAAIDRDTYERSHSGNAYFAAAAGRPNLHAITGALIDKVELDSSKPDSVVAMGVTFIHEGNTYTVKAKREVILSAGAYGSANILERSGIGSKLVIENLGIKCIIDNPNVGENLQDHLMSAVSYEVNDDIPTLDAFRDPAVAQKAMEQYQHDRSGPLSSTPGWAWANAPLLDFIVPLPKEELTSLLDKHLSPDSPPKFKSQNAQYDYIRHILESTEESSASHGAGSFQCVLDRPTTKEIFTPSDSGNYISMYPALAHPFSRGHVHIKSADCTVYPTIAVNHGGHPLDIEIMARHMMICEKVASSSPLKEILKVDGRRLPEGRDALTLENARHLVRSSASSNYHVCGSCAMMPEELGGVVDERLRVFGVRGLRVCDASVFPIIPRGNIMTTVYAVAEKGSDILKEDLK